MDEEIICERCGKKIESFIWFSRVDGKVICKKCNDKEQPKELMKQIADLKAKLTESKRKYEDRKQFCITETRSLTEIINNLLGENNKLKRRLAESEDAIKYLKGIKRYDIGEMITENAKLKQQLTEKDTEIYLLHTKLNLLRYDEAFKNLADDERKADE